MSALIIPCTTSPQAMPRRPIFEPNLMKPLRASRLRSSLRPSCRQTRTLDRDIRLAFLSSLKIRDGITSPRSAACWAVHYVSWGTRRASARHAGARIGGNRQTRTRTEIIDSGFRGADDACGWPTYPGIRFMIVFLEAAYLGRPLF